MRAYTVGAPIVMVVILNLIACLGFQIDSVIQKHDDVSASIQLGDPKEYVLALLEPIQASLHSSTRKRADQYTKDGVVVYIYYARSGRQPDDLTTDDEFTPYVFNIDILVAIGWAALGGPKTQGQATSDIYVQQSTTVIH